MLKITDITSIFPESSALAFHAFADDDEEYVVRLKKVGKNARRLFNEFVSAHLAQSLGLNRPSAEIVQVPREIVLKLNTNEFALSDQLGVGTKYCRGCRHIKPPEPYDLSDSLFPQRNRKHLSHYTGDMEALAQLYGYHVVTEWIQLADQQKYENLLADGNGSILFLDFDMAFNGVDPTCTLSDYRWDKMCCTAPFLIGVLQDTTCFTPWVKKIMNLDESVYSECAAQLPQEFAIERNFIDDIGRYLFRNREKFAEEIGLLNYDDLW
jgi:hypothetical protein